jgi:hypothetical protein
VATARGQRRTGINSARPCCSPLDRSKLRATVASPCDQNLLLVQAKAFAEANRQHQGLSLVHRDGKHRRPPGTLARPCDPSSAHERHHLGNEGMGVDASLHPGKGFAGAGVEIVQGLF